MHAGGAMSMWTRMPGQTWPGFAASFLWMWMTMMVPMMIPPFAAMLWRHRQTAAGHGAMRLGGSSLPVALGYFAVWSAAGLIAFPIVVAVAQIIAWLPKQTALVPVSALLIIAQLSRSTHPRVAGPLGVGVGGSWRLGIRLALHCARSCAPVMALGFVLGGSGVWAMTATTVAITAQHIVSGDRRRYRIPAFSNAVVPPTIGMENNECARSIVSSVPAFGHSVNSRSLDMIITANRFPAGTNSSSGCRSNVRS